MKVRHKLTNLRGEALKWDRDTKPATVQVLWEKDGRLFKQWHFPSVIAFIVPCIRREVSK